MLRCRIEKERHCGLSCCRWWGRHHNFGLTISPLSSACAISSQRIGDSTWIKRKYPFCNIHRQRMGKWILELYQKGNYTYPMAISFPHIAFSVTVWDLGLALDQQLTFAPHINHLCRDYYYQLRQLRVISRSLTSTATAALFHAFVTSRLDYCSTLYVGLPASGLPRACYPHCRAPHRRHS